MNWWEKAVTFFKDSYTELKKVTWLTRKEVIGSTAVIIVLILLLSVIVSFVDFIFLKLIEWVL